MTRAVTFEKQVGDGRIHVNPALVTYVGDGAAAGLCTLHMVGGENVMVVGNADSAAELLWPDGDSDAAG